MRRRTMAAAAACGARRMRQMHRHAYRPRPADPARRAEPASARWPWCRPWARCTRATCRCWRRRGSARGAGAVAASIFVNPLQFGPNEDLSRYPREEAGDLAMLEAAGCDLAWLPGVEAMYPPGRPPPSRSPAPPRAGKGAARPGHFRGVATVCTKLFQQTGAVAAMFGEKDWQQLQVIRQVVRDLDMPIRIIGCPTVREADGLAMSSRNRFLAPAERAQAAALPGAMRAAIAAWARGTAAGRGAGRRPGRAAGGRLRAGLSGAGRAGDAARGRGAAGPADRRGAAGRGAAAGQHGGVTPRPQDAAGVSALQ